jgi:hypothetical protein
MIDALIIVSSSLIGGILSAWVFTRMVTYEFEERVTAAEEIFRARMKKDE